MTQWIGKSYWQRIPKCYCLKKCKWVNYERFQLSEVQLAANLQEFRRACKIVWEREVVTSDFCLQVVFLEEIIARKQAQLPAGYFGCKKPFPKENSLKPKCSSTGTRAQHRAKRREQTGPGPGVCTKLLAGPETTAAKQTENSKHPVAHE